MRPKMWRAIQGRQGERGSSLVEVLIFTAISTLILTGVYDAYINFHTAIIRNATRARVQDDARRVLEQTLRQLRMAGHGVPKASDPAPLSAITAATPGSLAFLTDEGGSSTSLTAAAGPGSTNLTVASSSGFQVNNPIYVSDGAKYRAATVTALGGTSLTISPAFDVGFGPGAAVTLQPRQITYSFSGGTLYRDLGNGAGPQPLITDVSSLSFSYFDGSNNPLPMPGGAVAAIRRVVVEMTASANGVGHLAQGFTLESDIRIRN